MSKIIPGQRRLALVQDVRDVQMGVLDDGTPVLSARGLSILCGTAPSTIIELASEWSPTSSRPRDNEIRERLEDLGYFEDSLRFEIPGQDPMFTESAVIAVVEYYAFTKQREVAQRALRRLALKGFRDFVYEQVGYTSGAPTPSDVAWEKVRDRALLNVPPPGHFSVFDEMLGTVLKAQRAGLPVDEFTVPDISIGKIWAAFWKKNDLESKYGPRIPHEHHYPDYFPQAQANGTFSAWGRRHKPQIRRPPWRSPRPSPLLAPWPESASPNTKNKYQEHLTLDKVCLIVCPMDARTTHLALLVHGAATSEIRHDLEELLDALTHVTLEELAEAFAAAAREHPSDLVDLEALCDFVAPIAQECCGEASEGTPSDPALDGAVRALTRVLRPVYVDDWAAEERARNLVAGLIGDPHPDMWSGVLCSLLLRTLVVPLPEAAHESLALRCLAAFVTATRPADQQLDKVAHLTRYGVPARWAVCSAELVSTAYEGAA